MPPGTQQSKKPMSSAMQTDKGSQVVIPRAQNVQVLDMEGVTGYPSVIRISRLFDGRWVTPVNDAIMSITKQDNNHAGTTWRGVSKEDKDKIRGDLVPILNDGQISTLACRLECNNGRNSVSPTEVILDDSQIPTSPLEARLESGQIPTSSVAVRLESDQIPTSPVAVRLESDPIPTSLVAVRLESDRIPTSVDMMKLDNGQNSTSEQYAIVPDSQESPKAMLKFQADNGKYYSLEVITYHKGFLKLPGVLKHPNAEKFKNAAVAKMADFIAGNQRHLQETALNARSSNPINVIMRESIEASEALISSMAAGTSSATGGIPEDPVDYNEEEELDERQPTNVVAKHSLKTGDPIGEGFMDIDRLTVVTQLDDRGLKNVKDMMECGMNTKRELVLIEVNREKDLTQIKDESLDKEHKRLMEKAKSDLIKEREMSNIKEDELDREHRRQMEMLKLKAAISQGGGILHFDPVEEVSDVPASITNKRGREKSHAASAPRHLPAATEIGLKFFYQFMSAVALNTNMEGCMVMKFYEFYAKWTREKQALPVDRFSRHSFSSQVRAVKGISSQRTTKGTRYWFDHKTLKEYLQGKGFFDESANPLDIE